MQKNALGNILWVRLSGSSNGRVSQLNKNRGVWIMANGLAAISYLTLGPAWAHRLISWLPCEFISRFRNIYILAHLWSIAEKYILIMAPLHRKKSEYIRKSKPAFCRALIKSIKHLNTFRQKIKLKMQTQPVRTINGGSWQKIREKSNNLSGYV